MLRFVGLFSVFALPAAAWEFTPVPVCTLKQDGPLAVEVTHDPRRAEPYAITLSAGTPWPQGAIFGLRFEGGRSLVITTDRHRLSADGLGLTVTDRGFGNVLDGLEFNTRAVAFTGGEERAVSLDGAADPVRAFRACVAAPLS